MENSSNHLEGVAIGEGSACDPAAIHTTQGGKSIVLMDAKK
ncbi:hypothetical protein DB42_EU00220 [Neochlamydia sp. EPS4]|nr:hypothetical protein [Neochlamydia sp. EPS4]KIC75676.1 hypothetical protein DB42_EU00220 [Neochlamydia sp. EPS4]